MGGRGLPLVAADLLKFNLGARRYAGRPGPTGPQRGPAGTRGETRPAAAAGQEGRRWHRQGGESSQEQGSRPPFRPHSWFGKRRPRRKRQKANGRRRPPRPTSARPRQEALVQAPGRGRSAGPDPAGAIPGTALADDPDDEDPGWRLDEIYFEPPEPVPGRRIFIERAGGLRRHRRRHPPGRPRPGPEGAGLRRQDREDPEDGSQRRGPLRGAQDLQPDPGRPQAVLHLLLDRRPGLLRGGVAEERPDSLPAAGIRRRAVRPGGHLPGVDAGQHQRRHRLGVHQPRPGRRWTCRSTAATSASRFRPCWTPASPDIAGTVNVAAGGSHGHGSLRHRTARPGSGYPSQRPQSHPRPGNHGGADGDAERAAAAHAPDHPPPGPHRRVPAHRAPLLRGVLGEPDGHHPRLPPGARAGGGEPARLPGNPHPTGSLSLAPQRLRQISPLGLGADNPFRYLTVPPPKPPPPKAEQTEAGDSGWWGWPW